MTVGFVLDDTLDVVDGVQQAVLTNGAEMSKRGHDVHYIVADTSKRDGLSIHSLTDFISLRFNGNTVRTTRPTSKAKIQSLFSTIDFDVLYVQMPFSPFMSGRVISMAPHTVKIFGIFHILPFSLTSRVGTRLLRVMISGALKRCDGFYAVSEPALHFMESAFKIKGSVLPNPIDYKQYNAPANSVSSTNHKHKKTVVFVGRFDERKGVLQLVNAIKLLDPKYHTNTRFILCGKGPLHKEAVALSRQNRTTIEFPGFVTEKQKIAYLANATIAVFPSISGESFGIVLAEAMSAGAEITIGGDNPGYASVIGHWEESLFDARDPQSIADTIERFLSNNELRKKIGTEQHEYVKVFDVVNIVDCLEKQYACSIETKKR